MGWIDLFLELFFHIEVVIDELHITSICKPQSVPCMVIAHNGNMHPCKQMSMVYLYLQLLAAMQVAMYTGSQADVYMVYLNLQ